MMYWLFSRPIEPTLEWLDEKFGKKPDLLDANTRALKAGYNHGELLRLFQGRYEVPKVDNVEPGTYRNIMGNQAVALGLVAGADLAGLKAFLGSYPITPATDILQYMSLMKNHGVITCQMEDEIAGICTAIGASFAGHLGITTTSGPGLALKTEAMGLAVITELPLVIVNVQRGGPSTGLPTKVEQADLLQSIFGRNGEAPMPVVACSCPADAFECAVEACRIAVEYMTPVILLSDNYIANGAEPWKLPALEDLPHFEVKFVTEPEGYTPYTRDAKLARAWAKPGTPEPRCTASAASRRTRIRATSRYDPENHQIMCETRLAKVMGIRDSIPTPTYYGPDAPDLLVVGWGSTYGAIRSRGRGACSARASRSAACTCGTCTRCRTGLPEIFASARRIVVPEMNFGQLARLLTSEYPQFKFETHYKVQGKPFFAPELKAHFRKILEETA